MSTVSLHTADAIDPALVGRELGPWYMVPAWVSVPVAVVLASVLVWYFIKLGNSDVPRTRRWLRRIGLASALLGLVPLTRALTFVHPHEDRFGWALAWTLALIALSLWLMLALVDLTLVAISGAREWRELRRATLSPDGVKTREEQT